MERISNNNPLNVLQFDLIFFKVVAMHTLVQICEIRNHVIYAD